MHEKNFMGQCNEKYLKEQLNYEFRNEYSLQHIISVIKSMRMELDVFVAYMRGKINMKL
jgi:hypothetical protein